MAFSYNPSLATTKDWIRFRLGDTDSSWDARMRLEDEEINAVLAEVGARIQAALRCAKALRARLARYVDTSNTGLSVWASQRFAHLTEVIRELEQEAAGAAIPLWVQPKSAPAFSLGMHDHPEA